MAGHASAGTVKRPMKWTMASAVIVALCLAVSGCAFRPVSPAPAGIPATLNLPADFRVQKTDWLDNDRAKVGWPLGTPTLRGKALRQQEGVYPIHVMKAELPQLKGSPLMKDDLLIAVNGMSLGKDAENQFIFEVKRSIRIGRPLSVTRWRKGTIETVTIDLGFLKKEDRVPDLTRGEQPDGTHDWTLGPIGVNGWGFSRRSDNGASDKARQLLITLVDETGPAFGKLNVGDVILGAGGSRFSRDARKALAAAINEAEKDKNQGKLDLEVWRDGKELTICLTLKVLGSYSKRAPFDCPKTDKIINNAVSYIKTNRETLFKRGNWTRFFNGLGLLATGREDVMPIVRDLAHDSLLKDGAKLSVDRHGGMVLWNWSYRALFLCEYYLKTGDKAVLPTIEEYAAKIALGQSGVGTWGHGYAAKELSGHYHGRLGGYGALNQTGLSSMMVLSLANRCGIDNREIRDATKRGSDFFTFFIGKGTIPYGDHGATAWYDDNGKSGAAAILFDLLGDRKGSQFFSEMVLGSAPSGREKGHCGHYWSHLWGGLGAARGGNKSLQAFMNVMNPLFTLERQHNGRFAFQGNVGEPGHKGKPKTGLDCTGARLLQLCIPRRALYITGKDTPQKTHLTQDRINAILKAGALYVNKNARSKLTKSEILKLLRAPLSPTRAMAARTLAERELNVVEDLIRMLDNEDRFARYGAAEALGKAGFGSKKAADILIAMMETDRDTQFRSYAVAAMTNTDPKLGLSKVAKPAIPVMLKMAVTQTADDPRRILQHDVTKALFKNMRGDASRGLVPLHGLQGVDRTLLVPAVRSILRNDNGAARSTMSNVAYPLLTADEREQLWGDIYRATRHIAPSGMMFVTGVRKDGLTLMSKHGIKEGMELSAWYLRWQKGYGRGNGVQAALDAIEAYGTHAKTTLPYLNEHLTFFSGGTKEKKTKHKPEIVSKIKETVARIKTATKTPRLTSISDQLDIEDIPPRNGL